MCRTIFFQASRRGNVILLKSKWPLGKFIWVGGRRGGMLVPHKTRKTDPYGARTCSHGFLASSVSWLTSKWRGPAIPEPCVSQERPSDAPANLHLRGLNSRIFAARTHVRSIRGGGNMCCRISRHSPRLRAGSPGYVL